MKPLKNEIRMEPVGTMCRVAAIGKVPGHQSNLYVVNDGLQRKMISFAFPRNAEAYAKRHLLLLEDAGANPS